MDFEMMIKETLEYLQKNINNECFAVALFTEKGNFYIDCCSAFSNCCEKTDDDYSIINKMIEAGDNRVLKLVGIFKQGEVRGISVPCFDFCQHIFDMNKENAHTKLKISKEEISFVYHQEKGYIDIDNEEVTFNEFFGFA
ncbi:MAG: hypothetical protein FWD44_08175 [Oscillospiraceae bacterium]|nr:hypothetical protein [Oscillospiraceae bacterium]